MRRWTILFYRTFFGSGPTGLAVTFSVWIVAVGISQFLSLPSIVMPEGMWWFLFVLFVIDFFVTIAWSLKHLPFSKRGKELVTTGPYTWSRHPLYSAFIWSGTGIVVLLSRSWTVLFSALPISIFWAWHITGEEELLLKRFGNDYRKYMENTGQFFPKLKRDENRNK